ncbi:molybdopterin-guanine dinucleotide biosynthesis protein B [Orbus mooreae]|uniref:molybdopterin-guanine dinucleotide biosynthesis protein B n=1 Tax=Orbus mooreae TaxID=3074107 RepID=UPI00370D074A
MTKIIGICGYSGSGKTTLLKKLIAELKVLNIRLAVIKHSHHNMDIDIPGKDSYELRKAGAEQIIVASDYRWAMVTETPINPPNLLTLTNQFSDVELVLVEGFKEEAIPKIICYREETGKALFYDQHTIAIVSDTALDIDIPVMDINDIGTVANFIKNRLISE